MIKLSANRRKIVSALGSKHLTSFLSFTNDLSLYMIEEEKQDNINSKYKTQWKKEP